jgi:hypothetical protein
MKKKSSTSTRESVKTTFGKRKGGKAQKLFNKHDRSERNYRGQGK